MQIDEEIMETVTDFIFLGSKITANGDFNEIKRRFLLGRKAMTNLDIILKRRDITLLTNVHLVKAKFFPIVIYGCESWTIKKSWAWKNWSFWTVVLEETLENPKDCKEIQLVISKGDQSWRLMLKLKLQNCAHLKWRADSLEKTQGLGKIEGRKRKGQRGWDGWMASPTWWTWVWASSRSVCWTGKPAVLQSIESQRVQHIWATELNLLLFQKVCISLSKVGCKYVTTSGSNILN